MVSSKCCGKGGDECICAQNATCSCGKRSALQCDCERQATENTTAGDRCSCGQRPAGSCTCEGDKAAAAADSSANETDFTTRT